MFSHTITAMLREASAKVRQAQLECNGSDDYAKLQEIIYTLDDLADNADEANGVNP